MTTRDDTLCEDVGRMLSQLPGSGKDYIIKCNNQGLAKLRAARDSDKYIYRDNEGNLFFTGLPIVVEANAEPGYVYAVPKDEE